MTITVNGRPLEWDDNKTLKELILHLCTKSSAVVAELNGTIIKHPQWQQTPINDGDALELVNIVGGG